MPIPDSGVEATCAIAKARLASAGGVVVGLVFLEFFFLFFACCACSFSNRCNSLASRDPFDFVARSAFNLLFRCGHHKNKGKRGQETYQCEYAVRSNHD